MSNWIYKQTEPQLWTVGFIADGRFEPESDHGSPESAVERVRHLNGGSQPRLGRDETDLVLMLRAHEAAADSIAVEAEDRTPGGMTTPTYVAGYARAVADYAAYLRGESISENLANLLG